ncbi:VOC family protein [Agarivorans sp. QJM3NY_33]|uniref:VOC family protein n=1 Tax=Agarivorans sp. QJM3NY_33 TaxID=3421432 RepID=UPI003D7C4FB8
MQIYKILTRIFVGSAELEHSIHFYEKLFGKKCELKFNYSEKDLELAMVGSILLISGSADRLKPFIETKVTFLVDSIDEFLEFLTAYDSTILEYPKSVPTGKNMRVKHPDGLIAEYVEYKKEGKASQG